MKIKKQNRILIIENVILPPKGFIAITIFGIIFTRELKKISSIVFRHENIHVKQQLEMLFILFFIWYGIEWFVKLIITRNLDRAYRSISFEAEAYEHDVNKEYLKKRKRYSFIKYITKIYD